MTKRLTQAEFTKRVNKKLPTIKILGNYKGRAYHIKAKCLICGYIWNAPCESLISGHGCPKCARKKTRLTQQQFIKKVHKKLPNITILSKYKVSKKRVHAHCNICGYDWYPTANELLAGKGCLKCANNARKLTQQEFITKVKSKSPNIKILGRYTGSLKKVKVKCRKCGYIWWAKATHLMEGQGCPKCAGKARTQQDLINELHKINPHIKILGKYTISHAHILAKCLTCGYIWYPSVASLLRGTDCPKCAHKESKGEIAIEKYLKKHSYRYKWQYSLKNCKDKNAMPYDFAVFNQNNTLNCLIEYQGSQHFKPINYFGGKKAFKQQQRHDKIKYSYCLKHQIKLIYVNHYPEMSNRVAFIKHLVKTTLDQQLHVN